MNTSTPRTCQCCRTALPDDANPRRRYCDQACRQAAYMARKRGPRCQHCKAPMPTDKPAQAIYCQEKCRDRARRARDKAASRSQYVRKGYPVERVKARRYQAGDRFGSLVLVEYAGRSQSGDSLARFACDCGNVKSLRLHNVTQGRTRDCADRRTHTDPRSKGQAIGYSGAHNRVRLRKGSASRYLCPCGRPGEQWSYSHADQDQRADQAGKERGKPYSARPEHYASRCRSCHRRWDDMHKRLSGGSLSLVHVAVWTARQASNEQVTA